MSAVAATGPVPGLEDIAALAEARAKRRRVQVFGARILVLLAIFVPWEVGARTGYLDVLFYGQPSLIVERLWDWSVNGTFLGNLYYQVWVTLSEAMMGLAVGMVAGIFVGVALGQSTFLADVFAPFIKAVNAMPRIVLGALYALWFGLDTTPKVMLAATLVFFVVYFNAFQGVRNVDPNFIANARIQGASRLQVIQHVILPSALTWIIASLHVAIGLSITGAIVGEFIGATDGLGVIIGYAKNTLDSNGLFGAMIIIGLLALVVEEVTNIFENRLLAWKPPAGGAGAKSV